MSKVHHYLFIDIDNICKVQHLSLGISFSKNLPTQEVTVFKLHPIYLLSESVVSFEPKIHLGLTELTKAPL